MTERPKALLRNFYIVLRNTVLSLFLRPRGKAEALKGVGSILCIRIDRMGDLVITIPALKAIKENFKGARVVLLVKKDNERLAKMMPYADEVLIYEGFPAFLKKIKSRRFDIAVDFLMDYTVRTTFLAYASGAGIKAGFDILGRGRFYDISFAPEPENKTTSEYTSLLALKIIRLLLGRMVDGHDFIPSLLPGKDKVSEAERRVGLAKNGVGRHLVGFHPGGYYKSQRWPVKRFAEVADGLKSAFDNKTVIIGSKDEGGLVDEMVKSMKTKGAIKIVGPKLDELAALISLMDLLICNNSGPLHMAAAVGTPTVSTMGPTDPYLWRPAGSAHTVIRKAMRCSPCGRAVCAHHSCMRRIGADEVLEAASRHLSGNGGVKN